MSAKVEAFSLAEKLGWKKWGKPGVRVGSSYQCFRRKNEYCWIGDRYIERTGKVGTVSMPAQIARIPRLPASLKEIEDFLS